MGAGPVPFVDLAATHAELGGEIDDAVRRVVSSGRYLLGPELESFEREFAEYCGTEYCVGVSSGLSALELSLRAAGIGAGDEVVVPAYTFIATWLAVSRCGARPVPVDVCESTYNLDPALVGEAIGPRTAAIVPVHLRGEPADMEPLTALASEHGLCLVEDAAQAHGAVCRGSRVGALGDAAAFSFYPSKNLGALGDGGAVTTDDPALADRVRLLRNYGMRTKYESETRGDNSRLAEIQAAVLRAKLPRLDDWNAARARLAIRYAELLGKVGGVTTPEVEPWAGPVWHLFVVNLASRDAAAEALCGQGVETGVHYPTPPHLSPAYADLGWEPGSFPVAERLAATTLSLPMYPQLDPDRCAEIVAALRGAVDR